MKYHYNTTIEESQTLLIQTPFIWKSTYERENLRTIAVFPLYKLFVNLEIRNLNYLREKTCPEKSFKLCFVKNLQQKKA